MKGGFLGSIGYKVFGTGSSFPLGWHTGGWGVCWLAIFRGCFTNIGEIFILAGGGLSAGLSFYVV